MPHILKILKGVVKAISVIIILAFTINAFNGFLSVANLIDDQGIDVQDFEPGDLRINYEDLYLEVGVTIENNGIYTYDDVLISIDFQIRSNTTDWTSVINRSSAEFVPGIDPEGQDIEPGEVEDVEIIANLTDFDLSPAQIATLFGLSGNWTLADLLDVNYDVQLYLRFSIDYAFRQYQIDFELLVNEDYLEGGFA